jgi:hypothetical protein
MPGGTIEQLFGYGVLGVMFVLVMLGVLVPKWVVDEYRKREAIKDGIIVGLTEGLKKATEIFERRGRSPR